MVTLTRMLSAHRALHSFGQTLIPGPMRPDTRAVAPSGWVVMDE
jgi:hypothetical protein